MQMESCSKMFADEKVQESQYKKNERGRQEERGMESEWHAALLAN